MASEEERTSDSCNVSIRPVPTNLLPYVRSRVLHYVNETKDFSAEIHQTSETDARLVFYHGTKFTEERETESKVDGDLETATGNKIIVKNIPQSVDEEILELFFESGKKVKAGPVKSVQLNRQKNWAIIEFCEAKAVEIVMSKKPVTLLDTTLDINPYAPLLQGDESINGVEIRGLPSGLTQDILSLQIEGVPDSHTVSKVDKAVGTDDPVRTIVTKEETISNLNPVQLKMLSATRFPDAAKKKFPNVNAEIDHNKIEIVLKGDSAELQNAKLSLFETVSDFSIIILKDIPENYFELLKAKRVQEYIAEKLDSKKLVCTWEVLDSELVVCSSGADIASCATVISESVKEEIIPASDVSVGILYTRPWPERLTGLHKEGRFIYKVVSADSHTSIRIITTDDISTEVVTLVKQLLTKHIKIQKEDHFVSSTGKNLIEAYKLYKNLICHKVHEIESDLSMHHVSLKFTNAFAPNAYITISGTLEGIDLAKQRFRSLSLRI